MTNKIKKKLEELGATVNTIKSNSMIDSFNAFEFNTPLYLSSWSDNLCGVDTFLEKNISIFKDNEPLFYDKLVNYFFSEDSTPRGQTFFINKLFRPSTPNSSDYDEWHNDFVDDADVDLSVVRDVVGKGRLEFLQIFESYGYPDYYFICLSDPDFENPTVFSTDHEMFFYEIENEGKLEGFLDQFLNKDSFLKIVQAYINDK